MSFFKNRRQRIFISLVVYFCVSLPLVVNAAPEAQTRIVGGEKAPDGTWPWVVALLNSQNNDVFTAQYCAGTLIRQNWVLTAAHCVTDDDTLDPLSSEAIDIFAGSQRLDNDSGVRVAVKNVIVHPSYSEPGGVPHDDIALLELMDSVSESLIVPAVQSPMPDTLAMAVGWGSFNRIPRPNTFPRDLLEVELPIVSNADCNSIPLYNGRIDDLKMICAGYTNVAKDTCSGDSGGPLMVEINGEYEQVGVVSFGPEICAETYGVYARVSNYADWINAWIGGNGGQISDGDGGSGSLDYWWLAFLALFPLVLRHKVS